MKRLFCVLTLILTLTVAIGAPAQQATDTAAKASVTDKVITWYNQHLNYGTVTLLMAVESSFIPFPSEVIVPPAAYQACNSDNPALYKTDSKVVNVIFVILFATLGALIGALVNYFLALVLGRPIVYWFADSKVGHLLLLNSQKVKKPPGRRARRGDPPPDACGRQSGSRASRRRTLRRTPWRTAPASPRPSRKTWRGCRRDGAASSRAG